MRIPRIYIDLALFPGSPVTLDDFASRHLCQVLRCRAGQPLILFNGRGGEYSAILEHPDRRACQVLVTEFNPENRESPLQIHLGLALSKGDRFDWALQKATELGVTDITPLVTERSEQRLDAKRLDKKMAHWRRLIASSCEQSRRNLLASLHNPSSWEDWIALGRDGPAYIVHPGKEPTPLAMDGKPGTVSLAIGPEGGFSEIELTKALDGGFLPLSLGPRVLRTETAPAAAISVLQWLWGDWC